MLVTPTVVPASALPAAVSAERALDHPRVIAAEPHPMGSRQHEAAVRYLVDRLTAAAIEFTTAQSLPFV